MSSSVMEGVEEKETCPGLSASQRNHVAADVLRSLRHGTNRAFLRTARRAPDAATPLLETTLTWCATSCDPSVARRARYVLDLIDAEREHERVDHR